MSAVLLSLIGATFAEDPPAPVATPPADLVGDPWSVAPPPAPEPVAVASAPEPIQAVAAAPAPARAPGKGPEARWEISGHVPIIQLSPIEWLVPDSATGLLTGVPPASSVSMGGRVVRSWFDGDFNGLVLGAGIDSWRATFDHRPDDFDARVWEVGLQLGGRGRNLYAPSTTEFYVEGGAALHYQLLRADWYPSVWAVTPGVWAGMGLGFGGGKVRPLFGVQAGAVIGGADLSGATSTTVSDFSMRWSSARAWFRFEAGIAVF